jgi:hypothetical protein
MVREGVIIALLWGDGRGWDRLKIGQLLEDDFTPFYIYLFFYVPYILKYIYTIRYVDNI